MYDPEATIDCTAITQAIAQRQYQSLADFRAACRQLHARLAAREYPVPLRLASLDTGE